MSTDNLQPADSIDDWILFDEAYGDFALSHPQLGLQPNRFGAVNLRRNFADKLLATGTCRKLVNGRWLAHKDRFPQALFDILLHAREQAPH